MRHTFWSCLIRYKYEINPIKTVGATEWTRDAGRMDWRTDGQTDGQTEWNQYTPPTTSLYNNSFTETSDLLPVGTLLLTKQYILHCFEIWAALLSKSPVKFQSDETILTTNPMASRLCWNLWKLSYQMWKHTHGFKELTVKQWPTIISPHCSTHCQFPLHWFSSNRWYRLPIWLPIPRPNITKGLRAHN